MTITSPQPVTSPAGTGKPAYLCLPSIPVDSAHLNVADRIADLGLVAVYFNDTSLQMHIAAAGDARALAAVFTKAAELLEAAAAEGGA